MTCPSSHYLLRLPAPVRFQDWLVWREEFWRLYRKIIKVVKPGSKTYFPTTDMRGHYVCSSIPFGGGKGRDVAVDGFALWRRFMQFLGLEIHIVGTETELLAPLYVSSAAAGDGGAKQTVVKGVVVAVHGGTLEICVKDWRCSYQIEPLEYNLS
ncbi:hypothetical protein RHMOL_Rhmol12G0025000 [Rhododendron molle]|uniref:Uncharacterized protein n=1 Tax=Rhododendron molle TaxID=49168 RepID=A0ACC0LF81_RHOML|nr:hypothetical protein RHMOL_Rhmol12G0025000 [Rhododendron molle]